MALALELELELELELLLGLALELELELELLLALALDQALVMGWAAAGLRSMMASRRWPRPTRPSGLIQAPCPSGPRAAMWSRVVHSSAGSTAGARSW